MKQQGATSPSHNGDGVVQLSQLQLEEGIADSGDDSPIIAVKNFDNVPGGAHRRRQRIGAIAGVVLIVLVAAGVAVAIFTTSGSTSSISLPSEFSGRATVTDRYNPDMRYTAEMHKSVGDDGRTILEGTVEHHEPTTGNRVVHTLLDHRVYFSIYNDSISTTVPQRVECAPKYYVPPIGDIDQLFEEAVLTPVDVLDDANPGMSPCVEAGHRWKILWGVQEFVYCRPEHDTHVLVSDNAAMHFVADSYVKRPTLTIPTNVTTGEPAQCEPFVEYTALDGALGHPHDFTISTGRRVLRSVSKRQDRHLVASPRACAFIGGSSTYNRHSDSALSAQGANSYWGQYMASYLSAQCTSFTFVRTDADGKVWDDGSLRSHVCDEIADIDGQIRNKLVFTHGTGSLVLASAIHNTDCSLHSSARWYSSMAPFAGAKAADEAESLCSNYDSLSAILTELRWCKGSDHDKLQKGVICMQTSHQGDSTSFTEARDVARNNLDGAMCGHDSSGLYEGVGQGLQAIDSYVWFGEERDGVNKLSQCKTVYTGTWPHANCNDQPFANMHLNYLDGTCRFGDAIVDPSGDKSPCTWYKKMAERA